MNEQIEYFKRFSASYMRWPHFNFDRIVADIIRKDKETEEERKKAIMMKKLADSLSQYEPWLTNFDNDITFGTLRIKLPVDYQLLKA